VRSPTACFTLTLPFPERMATFFSVTQLAPFWYCSRAVALLTAFPLFVNLTVSLIAVADVVVPPPAATPVRL